MNRKPAFYITKRALASVMVGMERVVTKEPPYIVFNGLPEKHALDIWAVNGLLRELKTTLKLSAFDIETGREVKLLAGAEQLTLKPNQTTEIKRVDIPAADTTVIVAYLDDSETGERLARWVSWPESLKFLQFSKKLKLTARVEGDIVLLTANYPAEGVVISVPIEEGDDAVFDNFIDLAPGEEIRVGVKDLNGRRVQTRFFV
jgi:beta-mannosidase